MVIVAQVVHVTKKALNCARKSFERRSVMRLTWRMRVIHFRRNDGKTVTKVVNNRPCVFDNRHMVPYNPGLSRKYNCHINVEVTAGINAVKYIYKYIFKGDDRALIQVQANPGNGVAEREPDNEIARYSDSRYISAPQACWRIFSYLMHQHRPAIYRLPVHLPDQQAVYFRPDTGARGIQRAADRSKTRLTEFFVFCAANPEGCHNLIYADAPEQLTWNAGAKRWDWRRDRQKPIGRMWFVSPRAGKKYYLRLLLHTVRCPLRFDNLRSLDGIQYPTFRAAAQARGLLEDDREWHDCLREAATFSMGPQFRTLFATILCYHATVEPMLMFDAHYVALSDDIRHILTTRYEIQDATDQQIRDVCLAELDKVLNRVDGTRGGLHGFGLPLPSVDAPFPFQPLDAQQEERNQYDPVDLEQRVLQAEPSLTSDQRRATQAILDSLLGLPQLFFLQGPGGTGKTFVENYLLAKVRSEGSIALAVASSGIAALFLLGGRTAHSRFKIPLNATADYNIPISKTSPLAHLLRETKLIIWNEAPMMHRFNFEAVDRCLRDVRNDDRWFGGLTMVFAGDWAQTLPIGERNFR